MEKLENKQDKLQILASLSDEQLREFTDLRDDPFGQGWDYPEQPLDIHVEQERRGWWDV